MDEPGVRAMLDKLAAGDPPPSRVSVEQARRRGRARLRWRRAGLAGAPVLAAATVTAIVMMMSAGAASIGVPAAGASRPATASPPASVSASPAPLSAAPRDFDPLARYVYWGWLPAGQQLVSGQTSRSEMYLTAGPKPGSAAWALTVYAGGRCHRGGHTLTCANGGIQLSERLSPGPLVNGRRAFWGRGYLAWQYARGGWAWLEPAIVHQHRDRADAPRVASTVRFGTATAPSLWWAAQLTSLPGRWQVDSTEFTPQSGKALARQFYLTVAGHRADAPGLTVDPAAGNSSCSRYPDGQSVREVISGYHVTINHIRPVRGDPPTQQVCAAHADGLSVFISEYDARPLVGVVSLFRHHLRLLGTDPANWVTAPVG